MAGRWATLVAVLSVVLVACSAEAQPASSPRATPEASPLASPLAAVTPAPTPVVTPTSTPETTPSATSTPDAASRKLAPDTIAVVATNDLVVKSEPGTGKSSYGYKPWLQRGDQLYVLRGPVRASGYQWYEVMPLSARYEDSGWVAAASKSGKPWIKPLASAPGCPVTPSTVAGLAALPDGVRLACFSGVPITVTALLATCSVEEADAGHDPPMFDGVYDPLADVPSPIELYDPWVDPCPEEGDVLPLNLDPASTSVDALRVGHVANVTGIFDHPAAAGCVWFSFIEGGPDADPEWCRPRFVVTRID